MIAIAISGYYVDCKYYTFSVDQFVPPNIDGLPNLTSNTIIFTWHPVAPDCPAIHYNILASNCGSCPTTTNHTNVTCTDVPTNSSMCTFAVRTVVCGNNGQFSDAIHVALMANYCDNLITNSSNNIGRSALSGAITSATILGGIIGACVTVFITIIIQRKVKVAQSHANKPGSSDSPYEDISQKQSSSSVVIDTKKNVAYGQAAL